MPLPVTTASQAVPAMGVLHSLNILFIGGNRCNSRFNIKNLILEFAVDKPGICRDMSAYLASKRESSRERAQERELKRESSRERAQERG